MKSNSLVFISDWITETDKPNYRTKLYLKLDDDCNNGVCDFYYRVEKEHYTKGHWVFYYSGDDTDFVNKFSLLLFRILTLITVTSRGNLPIQSKTGLIS